MVVSLTALPNDALASASGSNELVWIIWILDAETGNTRRELQEHTKEVDDW